MKMDFLGYLIVLLSIMKIKANLINSGIVCSINNRIF